jgi:spectinomycin phosphotransferase
LSEPARHELARHVDTIDRALHHLDDLTQRLDDPAMDLVVTHGEAHPGNLLQTTSGLALIDWDTVALARPERDLWMIADPAVVATYREATGITPDPDAIEAFRLIWALSDLAAFTVQLRGEHHDDADAHLALGAIRSVLAGSEPAPYGRRPPDDTL